MFLRYIQHPIEGPLKDSETNWQPLNPKSRFYHNRLYLLSLKDMEFSINGLTPHPSPPMLYMVEIMGKGIILG